MDQLLSLDRAHVWHPYARVGGADPLVVRSAAGVRLHLADGRRPVDAMSSWWAAIHGYRHPHLDAALAAQAGAMAHVMFGGLTHEPAVTLARRLVDRSPAGLEHVFFADSGSVAVEVALKMALQAQRGRGQARRTRIAALRGGYHGDTFGAMSVCDPVGGMHAMFTDVLAPQVFLPRPPAGRRVDLSGWAAEAAAALDAAGDTVAAIVAEPVLQGAGGMHAYSPAVLSWLRAACDERGLLLVLDEVATGFWRTGAAWGADHAGVAPDIACVGKALTGGYLTLAATLCTPDVAAAIEASESGVLMHGPTFMANPLACAVANASLDLLDAADPAATVARIGAGLAAGLAPAADLPGVVDVRTLGAVGVIQLDRPVDVARASRAALDAGVWVRPFRDLIYTMPPYVCTDDDVATICAGLVAAAREETR